MIGSAIRGRLPPSRNSRSQRSSKRTLNLQKHGYQATYPESRRLIAQVFEGGGAVERSFVPDPMKVNTITTIPTVQKQVHKPLASVNDLNGKKLTYGTLVKKGDHLPRIISAPLLSNDKLGVIPTRVKVRASFEHDDDSTLVRKFKENKIRKKNLNYPVSKLSSSSSSPSLKSFANSGRMDNQERRFKRISGKKKKKDENIIGKTRSPRDDYVSTLSAPDSLLFLSNRSSEMSSDNAWNNIPDDEFYHVEDPFCEGWGNDYDNIKAGNFSHDISSRVKPDEMARVGEDVNKLSAAEYRHSADPCNESLEEETSSTSHNSVRPGVHLEHSSTAGLLQSDGPVLVVVDDSILSQERATAASAKLSVFDDYASSATQYDKTPNKGDPYRHENSSSIQHRQHLEESCEDVSAMDKSSRDTRSYSLPSSKNSFTPASTVVHMRRSLYQRAMLRQRNYEGAERRRKASDAQIKRSKPTIHMVKLGHDLQDATTTVVSSSILPFSKDNGFANDPSQPLHQVNIRIVSAGMHDGDFASIVVDSVEHCPNKRGFNLVILCPFSLEVKDARNFNTLDDAFAARHMVNYIASIPQHHHVLCAAKTDCTSRMTPDAIVALQSIGAQSFSPGFGGSWALQGSKGGNRNATRQACRKRLGGCAAIMNTLTQSTMQQAEVMNMMVLQKAFEEDQNKEADDKAETTQKSESSSNSTINLDTAGTGGFWEHALEGKVKVLRRQSSNSANMIDIIGQVMGTDAVFEERRKDGTVLSTLEGSDCDKLWAGRPGGKRPAFSAFIKQKRDERRKHRHVAMNEDYDNIHRAKYGSSVITTSRSHIQVQSA